MFKNTNPVVCVWDFHEMPVVAHGFNFSLKAATGLRAQLHAHRDAPLHAGEESVLSCVGEYEKVTRGVSVKRDDLLVYLLLFYYVSDVV